MISSHFVVYDLFSLDFYFQVNYTINDLKKQDKNNKSQEVFMDHQKTGEQLAREARNAYYRAYRKKNKERIKEINNRYWMRQAEKAQREGLNDGNP